MSSDWDFNLYEELEISKTATQEEIKKAYKKMAIKWHPDKNQGNPEATEKFQKISHAYTILSDENKKAYYDKYGKVDNDNFNFEDFMKDFSFQFGDIFGDNFMFTEHIFGESRHCIKLMTIRKNIEEKEIEITEEISGIKSYIYGKGKGLICKNNLSHFYNNSGLENDWEFEEENEENNPEDEEIEECEDEDVFEFFISSNITIKANKKINCNYCKRKYPSQENKYLFDKSNINNHFIENHKNEFEEFFGGEVSWDDSIKENQPKSKKQKKNKQKQKQKSFNPFENMGGMGGMPFMFDMNQMGKMGQMFQNMNEDEHQMMMDDLEKMMGGFGFPGGMPGFSSKGKNK